MILFFSVYLIILFLYTLSVYFKSKFFDKIIVILSSAILSILPGFKSLSVGTDTMMYNDILNSKLTDDHYYVRNIEPGYIFLVKTFQALSLEEYFFYILYFLSNFLILSFIFSLPRHRFLVLVSYLTFSNIFIMGFNILRQYLALSMYVYGLKYLFKSKYIPHIFIIFLCISIHYSSIFFLFFSFIYLLITNNYKKISYLFCFLLPFIFNFTSKFLMGYLSNFTGKETFENYIGKEQAVGGGLWFFFYTVIVFYFYIVGRKNDLIFNFIFSCILLWYSLFINITFLNLPYEGPGRIIVCCFFGFMVIFSYLKFGRYIVLNYLFFLMLFALYFYYMYILNGLHGVFPYSSIL